MPSGVCKYSLVFCLCNSLVSSDTGRPIAAHDAEQCSPLLRCLTPHLGQFFSLYCPLIPALPLHRKPLIYYFPPLYPTLSFYHHLNAVLFPYVFYRLRLPLYSLYVIESVISRFYMGEPIIVGLILTRIDYHMILPLLLDSLVYRKTLAISSIYDIPQRITHRFLL